MFGEWSLYLGMETTWNVFHIGEEALMYLCWETWVLALLVFLLRMLKYAIVISHMEDM